MKNLLIVLLILGIISFAQTLSFAQTEAEIRGYATIRLTEIFRGQISFFANHGYFYPDIDAATELCPNDICWQGQVLSSLNAGGSSNQDLINILGPQPFNYCPQYLSINTGGNGDVRFRCRRQGSNPLNVWCFAYRCEHASPAGCKQKWRLRFRPSTDWMEVVPLECFDVGNTGVCAEAHTTIGGTPVQNCNIIFGWQ